MIIIGIAIIAAAIFTANGIAGAVRRHRRRFGAAMVHRPASWVVMVPRLQAHLTWIAVVDRTQGCKIREWTATVTG
ncbi:hypothetical protein RvVAR0630_07150 [Agrobacterium vitis]|nr:hypothetical protein RvVAR0630_07150 [Agrobacterium vitis]